MSKIRNSPPNMEAFRNVFFKKLKARGPHSRFPAGRKSHSSASPSGRASVSKWRRSGGVIAKASELWWKPKLRSKPASRSWRARAGFPRKPWMVQRCWGRSCLRSANITSKARTTWSVIGRWCCSDSATCAAKTAHCVSRSAPRNRSRPHSPTCTTSESVSRWERASR